MVTYTVIGHGRSPERKKWGKRIDNRSDFVIRMWDCAWQEPADYGVKYDYGFLELYGPVLNNFYLHNKRQPKLKWLASVLFNGDKLQAPPNTERIYQHRWARVGVALGGVGASGRLELTRGTIAGCWAIEMCEPGDTVVLVGFDNIRAGIAAPIDEAFSPAYRANPGTFSFESYEAGVSKFGNHDYAIEHKIMQNVAKLYGVHVRFAEEVWGNGPL